jgi:hypothetical protein
MSGFLDVERAAVGRSSLLPPQPDQPGPALAERQQLRVRLPAGVQEPAAAVLLAWLVGMTSRQIGHFFEPRDYDEVNHATHEYKGGDQGRLHLRRKIVLMTIWRRRCSRSTST